MKIALATKSAFDGFNPSPTHERLLNCFLSGTTVRPCPGLVAFSSVPGPWLREMKQIGDELWAVSAGRLYFITEAGVAAYQVDVPDDQNTVLKGHRDDVTISVAGDYGVFSGGSISYPGGGRFDDVGSLAFLNNFTVMSQRGGQEIQWSDAGLPETLNALNFATSDARDDNIIRIINHNAYLWVFKERSFEIWQVTASGFKRIPSEVKNRGLKGFRLVYSSDKGLLTVTTDNLPRIDDSPIGGPNIVRAISNNDLTNVFYYEYDGHQFCVFRFSDRPAFVFDLATKLWHERTGPDGSGAWQITHSAFAWGRWFLGSNTGTIYTLSDVPVDDGQPLPRVLVSQPFRMKKGTVDSLEVYGRSGASEIGVDAVGDDTRVINNTDKRAPTIQMEMSKDGGFTYDDARRNDFGKVGDYAKRVEWRNLGMCDYSLTFRLTMTDPVDTTLEVEADLVVS